MRFDVAASSPKGEVRVGGEAAAQSFTDDETFTRAMESVMLPLLGLTPIPASQTTGDGIREYEDGWTAYTLALLSDTDSDAIIGEFHGNYFTGRLLQVYVGLPWAMTLFQIHARLRRLADEAAQRKRKIAGLGGHSVEAIEAALADIVNRIEDEGARSRPAQDLLKAQTRFTQAREYVRQLYDRRDEHSFLARSVKDARIEAERVLLALREEEVASTFLHRLKPVCCPRCSAVIDEERRRREATGHRCSVCDTAVSGEPDANALAGAIASDEQGVKDARSLEQDAQAALADAQSQLADAERERDSADITLQRLGMLGKAGDLQRLEAQRARLEGMLEIARLVQGADLADEESMAILKAAEAEADSRVKASSEEILGRASDEIAGIVRKLAMRDVEAVKLKRNAHVQVWKGGSISNWGNLTAGEKLRLRIATVIALVRTAREFGVGRHPGLLFIDSPGREELQDQNLGDMLAELARLAEGTPNLQLFVSMRGVEAARRAICPERLLTPGKHEALW